jgi:hypothetical protein
MSKTYKMFAAMKQNGGPMAVCWYANAVRTEVGSLYNSENEAAGWKKAMRDGWRVRKVRVVVPLP